MHSPFNVGRKLKFSNDVSLMTQIYVLNFKLSVFYCEEITSKAPVCPTLWHLFDFHCH